MGLSKILRSGEKETGKGNGNADVSTMSINTGMVNKEYLWACELSSDNKEYKWTFDEDMEDDDEDYIQHGLVIKSICLGAGAVDKEENIVVIDSIGSNGETVTATIANLTKGINSMVGNLSLTLDGKCGAMFKLVEGSGPVSVSGNEILDFPQQDIDGSQAEDSRLEETEDDDEIESEDDDEDESFDLEKEKSKAKTTKRRASTDVKPKQQKQKAKIATKEEKEDDDDDEEEEESDDEEEESESDEDIKPKKNKKEIAKAIATKPKPKSPAATTANKKGGKKGKK